MSAPRSYRVRWEIELDGSSALHAAQEARRAQLDPYNLATSYEVFELDEDGGATGKAWTVDTEGKFPEITPDPATVAEFLRALGWTVTPPDAAPAPGWQVPE